MRASTYLFSSFLILGCEGALTDTRPRVVLDPPTDGGAPPIDDASMPMPDAPAAAPDAFVLPPEPEVALLAPDLAIDRVDLFQTVRVPLVRAGAAADRDGLPIVAGRDAIVRVHAEALAGWSAREITAVVEIDRGGTIARFTDARVPQLPASDDDPESVFAIAIPGDAIAEGARFRIRLEDARGVESAPDALHPAFDAWADLGAEDTGTPVVVLVPFRYENDGSGRLPDTSEAQLARIRDELTSRFPYARVDLRVHEVVGWSRANRIGGNVDWGAVNARLIAMRDEEGAAETEYWYGLVAPDTSRAAYCDRVVGSCVTGQAYVATLRGSRVGSGVGFGDVASVRTLAHELGHEHGRSHTPCGTSSSDSGYPYPSGRIGVWGWDRRTGDFHDPDVATDMLGYCDRQWISDYTYRAMHDRQSAMRAATWSVVGAPIARRFVTIEDGAVTIAEPVSLRRLPGDRTIGRWLDARGRAIGEAEVGALIEADGDARTYVIPAHAPAAARAIAIEGETISL